MSNFTRTTAGLTLMSACAVATLTGCVSDVASAPTSAPSATAGAGATAGPDTARDVADDLADLEEHYAARIGVSAFDPASGQKVGYRVDERFGYASTLKAFTAAAFLDTVPAAERESVATWSQADIDAAGYSPVTSQHLDGGLTLSQLAEATVRESDNTALNLVLEKLGGPGALDEILLGWGDDTSQVANYEPELNVIEPGSTDDTTTPAAFTANLAEIFGGDILSEASETTVLEWMNGNATGDALIRAGAPEGWTVADKSGGAGGIRNDLAVVTPPGGDPVYLTIFTVKLDPGAEYENAAVADAARVVLDAFR